MKGDFSRIRFSLGKQYTAVLDQQGRPALDADANEQCAINDYLREVETLDVVGPVGGPEHDEGFAISVENNAIEIGPGRYYVYGILCENLEALSFLQQPFLINPAATDAALLGGLAQGSISGIQVWLEVWQRLVTGLDDPCLREPALGQADTTDRLQTVWRVVASGVQGTTPGGFTGRSPAAGATRLHPRFPVRESIKASSPISLASVSAFVPPRGFSNCCSNMQPGRNPAPTGKMTAFTGGEGDDCSCQPTPSAGYVGLENQLYRIEIHHGGDETQATFKWSRENGSVVTAITGLSGSSVYVDSLGPDANLGFSPGQWVEVSDDSDLFGPHPNQPGDLFQVQSVTPETLSLVLTQAGASADPTRNARLRRWDQFGSAAVSAGIKLPVGTPYALENGISIEFAAGNYEPGDYWLIVARTATGAIEWPPCDSDGCVFQPPHRVWIYRAPLACIQWDPHLEQAVPHDCRTRFYPLTELTPPPTPQAMQVTAISWFNDDLMTLDQLAAKGLTVTLNQSAPDSRYVTPANFSVIVEVAVPFGPADQFTNVARSDSALRLQEFLSTIGVFRTLSLQAFEKRFVALLRFEVVIDGETSSSGAQLTWQAPWEPKVPAETLTLELLDVLLLLGAVRGEYGRVRVKLAGNRLFAGPLNQVFLDGECLSVPAVRADGATPRIDLQLPSGSGAVASDFESWFYLAPTQVVAALTIDHPNLLVNPDGTVVDASVPTAGAVSPKGTVTLLYPAVADTTVSLSVIGPNSAGILSIPGSVTIPKAANSITFPITIQANPGPVTDTWQMIASLSTALNFSSSQAATLTITGTQGVTGIHFNFSALGIRIDANKKISVVDLANEAGGTLTPQGTITLSSPVGSATEVSLTMTGGQEGVVKLPEAVTVRKNQSRVTFPITVVGIPKKAQSFSVTATLTPPAGTSSSVKTALTVKNLK